MVILSRPGTVLEQDVPLETKAGVNFYAWYKAGAQKYLSIVNTTLNLVTFPIFYVAVENHP